MICQSGSGTSQVFDVRPPHPTAYLERCLAMLLGRSGPKPQRGSLYCVLGQDPLLLIFNL